MVTEIRIYIEGGGNDNSSKTRIRRGLNSFLSPLLELARNQGCEWSLILCGGRNNAFANFLLALRQHPNAFCILLVDSEGKVTLPRWEHLRRQDRWDIPDLPEDHCHFMVRTIEAWLVADPEALASFYGQGFRRSALPQQEDVEAVEKDDLMAKLSRAVRDTSKGTYKKIDHCAEILKRLDRQKVRSRARHCDLLFTTLEARILATAG